MRLSKHNTQRVGWLVGAITILATTIALSTPPAETPLLLAMSDADSWVAAHESALPTDLATLSKLPYLHRLAVRRANGVPKAEAYLREHLEAFVVSADQRTATQTKLVEALGRDLNADQVAVVRFALDSLHAMAAVRSVAQRQAFSKDVCARAAAVFDSTAGRLIFGTIGLPDPSYSKLLKQERARTAANEMAFLPNPKPYLLWVGARLGVTKMLRCECSASFCCDQCLQTFPACSPTDTGCGCLGFSDCTDRYCIAS